LIKKAGGKDDSLSKDPYYKIEKITADVVLQDKVEVLKGTTGTAKIGIISQSYSVNFYSK